MNLFSISELAQYAGVKPHTIRMWEQRYNALQPHRSEGNTRYYDSGQLRRLLNIVSLMEYDHKVSDLCRMNDDELFRMLEKHQPDISGEHSGYYISQLIKAAMNFDELHFEKIFSHCLLRYGVRDAYVKVVYPLLNRVGILWATNGIRPAEEHFITNIIRQKLFTAIDSLPPASKEAKTWLLFLPEEEWHDIGLLFAHFLIRLAGYKSIYLGANLPDTSLNLAMQTIKPDFLLLFMVRRESVEETADYLKEVQEGFSGKKIFVACNSQLVQELKWKGKLQPLASVDALEQQLHV